MLYENLAEIMAVVSLLIKFGFDDIIEDQKLFIAFLNEIGITINGKKVTQGNLYNLTQDITTSEKKRLIEEFNMGHQPIYRQLALYTNSPRLA